MTWATEFYSGKTVVITGGSSGIGQGLGRAFAAAGATVHATGATVAEIAAARETAPELTYTVLDVRDNAAVEAYAAGFASVAALVNCAGVNLRAAELTVPLDVSVGTGRSWHEAAH